MSTSIKPILTCYFSEVTLFGPICLVLVSFVFTTKSSLVQATQFGVKLGLCEINGTGVASLYHVAVSVLVIPHNINIYSQR